MELPIEIFDDYELADGRVVRSWSFGAVTRTRESEKVAGPNPMRSSLGDQAIFGPVRDDHCVCGKYVGSQYIGIICDRCGVKLGPAALRRQRFGHINLAAQIAHPIAGRRWALDALPVPPAFYQETGLLVGLDERYEAILRYNDSKSAEKIEAVFAEITAQVVPVFLQARQKQTEEETLFA